MWLNYEQEYRDAVKVPSFLAWRKMGAKGKADNIVSVCGSIQVRSAIEIGCGTGEVLRELKDRRFSSSYAGTDVSLTALVAARMSLRERCDGTFVSDAGNLPLRDKTYTVAILSHVLEHLDQAARAAHEASRVAEFVVIEVPTEKVATNWFRRKVLGRKYASAQEAGHVQFWSPRSILQFLKNDCGFEILAWQREAISKEEGCFGKQGIAIWKPLAKHLIQSLLPPALWIWIFTTHTTVLCRRSSEKRVATIEEAAYIEHPERAGAGGYAA